MIHGCDCFEPKTRQARTNFSYTAQSPQSRLRTATTMQERIWPTITDSGIVDCSGAACCAETFLPTTVHCFSELTSCVCALTQSMLNWTGSGLFTGVMSSAQGRSRHSRIALGGWWLQESPSFLVPVGVLAIGGDEVLHQMTWKAKVVGACFLVHYLHRAFLYPLQIRPSRETPLLTSCCAYAFTCLNGLLQVRTHSIVHAASNTWTCIVMCESSSCSMNASYVCYSICFLSTK